MNTTLYDHNVLGSDEKPLIPNIEFKKLVEALQAGDKEALPEALKKYSLEHYQNQIATGLHNEIK